MRNTIGCIVAFICVSACGATAETSTTTETELGNNEDALRGCNAGAVFTQSNDAAGNTVHAFKRGCDGKLTSDGSYATQGMGSSNGLGAQGAVWLTSDHKFLLAVNAGSNDISSFMVNGSQLTLRDKEPALGTRPISVTESHGLVYVLTAEGIRGFRLDCDGKLSPIAGSAQPLSASGVAAAQIQFTDNGRSLIVVEKSTNLLDSYRVTASGGAMPAMTFTSAGTTPFGFDITHRGVVVVSEAVSGSASSYEVANKGSLRTVTPALPSGELAACWLTISGDDRFAFVANAQSNSISTYSISRSGKLGLLDPRGAVLSDLGRPLDLAVDSESTHLYVLDAANHRVEGFDVARDAVLEPITLAGMLPSTATGIAAY